MNPRPSRRTISLRAAGVSALLTVIGAAAFAVPMIATASAVSVNTSPDSVQTFTPEQNNPSGWPDCADGIKVSYDGQNRMTYTLSSPATLLVIKSATWNFIWNDPSAGVYGSPVAPDGKVHAISHVIVCGAVTTATTATATASESVSESASATGSESASASESATDNASASASDTATASASESETASQQATETVTETATGSTPVAAVTGTATGSTPVAAVTARSTSTPSNPSLAHTGSDPVRLVGIALALLGLGVGFWAVGRRRVTAPRHH